MLSGVHDQISARQARSILFGALPDGMDSYALRRARALLNKVGIITFHQLLDRV
jgi:hypothetical protein